MLTRREKSPRNADWEARLEDAVLCPFSTESGVHVQCRYEYSVVM